MFSDLQQIISTLANQVSQPLRPQQPPTPEILNQAFLTALSGSAHPASEAALKLLQATCADAQLGRIAAFYLDGLGKIERELDKHCQKHQEFQLNLAQLAEAIANGSAAWGLAQTPERFWKVFFPEALQIRENTGAAVESLRRRRGVAISKPNGTPIQHVAKEVIFTSNVLLTIPQSSSSIASLPISGYLKERLDAVTREPQKFWYDHPIHLGVEQNANEILYGLRGLETAVEAERERGNLAPDERVTCLLSISVTHEGLQSIAKDYVEEELSRCEALQNLDIYVFTESDTKRLTDELLIPLAQHLDPDAASVLGGILGVDGEYGRHYSFLKAITALWPLLQAAEVKGTFKIDLDQVFPQKALIQETGKSAFEHLRTPLWGAEALDSEGNVLELGMIAGALVNERDIGQSLFTPDVPFPEHPPTLDEHIFFSTLPQALSTEAEMMTRYGTNLADGETTAIQRIHVTGGTNGILVEHLRRHRPFTPSFISRAEDQAYILSVFGKPGPKLAYVHAAGLFMRHDKEAFAQDAIESAYVGKLIGDYIRILYFSRYAQLLAGNAGSIKKMIDPFTGCFVSPVPETLVHLRFALKALTLYAGNKRQQADDFVTTGAPRITAALTFSGPEGAMGDIYRRELRGWNLYYDALDRLELGLKAEQSDILALAARGRSILQACRIETKRG